MTRILRVSLILFISFFALCSAQAFEPVIRCATFDCQSCQDRDDVCQWCGGRGCLDYDAATECDKSLAKEACPAADPNACSARSCEICLAYPTTCKYCLNDGKCIRQSETCALLPEISQEGKGSEVCVDCRLTDQCQTTRGTCVGWNRCACNEGFRPDSVFGCKACGDDDANPACSNDEGEGLSAIVIVIIVFGVLLFVVAIAGGLLIYCKVSKKKNAQKKSRNSGNAFNDGGPRRGGFRDSRRGSTRDLHGGGGGGYSRRSRRRLSVPGGGITPGGEDDDLVMESSLGEGVIFKAVSREQAERDIAYQSAGAYLVRPSTKPGCLSLTYKARSGEVVHILLLNKSRTGWHKEGSQTRFQTVLELLASMPLGLNLPQTAVDAYGGTRQARGGGGGGGGGGGFGGGRGGGKTTMDRMPQASDALPVRFRARVLYDCEPEAEDELALREGEIVDILDDDDEDWWIGRSAGGLVGNIPSDYVELV